MAECSTQHCGILKRGLLGIVSVDNTAPGITTIKHSTPYHQLLAHLTKFTGILQMLAMKRGVSLVIMPTTMNASQDALPPFDRITVQDI